MEALEQILQEISVKDVEDSSLFPAAPEVNPSWTIMALARHVATEISTRG